MSTQKQLPEDPQERLRVLQESFYITLGNFFSGGTYDNILLGLLEGLKENLKKTNGSLQELNESIKKADESSTKLTKALNRITIAGVIVALLSLVVAGLSVYLEYYKFFVG